MKRRGMKKTICLRCGYPSEVPERLYDEIKNCHMCRTPKEKEEMKKRMSEITDWLDSKIKKEEEEE